LFDWVYARRYDGEFLLRIEDTDQKRLVKDAEEVLYQAFDWLNIEPDESPRKGGPAAPYRQSDRLDVYQKYAQQLVADGHAYYCFCSQERLNQVRKKQKQAGRPPMYDRHCRNLTEEEVKQRLADGEEAVIRMKIPDDQTITVHDKLRGDVEFESKIVDDQVLLKSDGFPTYHLAVVVDDHLMGITHLVRGEEWLSSAPKHVLLYQYFDWDMPELIHTPTLRNPDKSKLSKRKGNTSVWWYREHGFLPQALNNFLALLVWKPDEQTEVFTKEEMLDSFEWEDMNVTGPIFDVNKLEWLNGKYLREMDLVELKQNLLDWADWVEANGQDSSIISQVSSVRDWCSGDENKFDQALMLGKERAKTLVDIPQAIAFYFADQLEYDRADLLQGHEPDEMTKVLAEVDQRLTQLDDYNSDTWEQTIRQTADDNGFSHKDLFMALRSAETARKYTPPLFDVMEVLGRKESSRRISQAIKFLQT
jgi:glutamyl-tRNA synthetase